MVFEMPEEISGQKNRSVLCQGRVIRSRNGSPKEGKEQDREGKEKNKDGNGLIAASIVDYKFIR